MFYMAFRTLKISQMLDFVFSPVLTECEKVFNCNW